MCEWVSRSRTTADIEWRNVESVESHRSECECCCAHDMTALIDDMKFNFFFRTLSIRSAHRNNKDAENEKHENELTSSHRVHLDSYIIVSSGRSPKSTKKKYEKKVVATRKCSLKPFSPGHKENSHSILDAA